MIPKLDGELKDRNRDDYAKLIIPGLSRQLPPHLKRQSIIAVAFAYTEAIQLTAQALKQGSSVLVRGSPTIAHAFVEVLAPEMQRDPSKDFLWSEAREAQTGSFVAREADRVVPNPSHELVRDFQRALLRASEDPRNVICVIDFLDLFAATPGADQSDLMYLLNNNRAASFLSFCSPDLALPPLIRDRFVIQIALPRLRRERIWTILTTDEVQKTLNVEPLTVAHQVALYHAIAGTEALRCREIVEGVNNDVKNPTSPFEIIDQIKTHAATFIPRAVPINMPHLPGITDQLEETVIRPFHAYARVQSLEDVHTLDARIAHNILLTGNTSERDALIARWLAGALNAPLFVTNGALLSEVPSLFRQARSVYPSVILIRDIELGLLGSGEPLRVFASAWQSVNLHEPLIVIASTQDANALPPALRARFKLSLNLE